MASFQVLFAFLLFLFVSPNVEAETKVCNVDMPSKFPFCDRSLLHHFRAMDLVNRMTLEEKVAQLGDSAAGVPRLNLPPYNWWSEALHGVSDVGRGTQFDALTPSATSFPTVILAAASFNETLSKRIGVVVSDEARALHNVELSGLTFWSPNVNLVRDPRWGRTSETPGEDPFVIGKYAVNYVRGLQDVEGYTNIADPNGRPLKVGACCKHYAAYDVDKWADVDRFHFDAQVTQRDMVETFLYPFEMCVKEGDVVSVMCSYNKVNGIPTRADPNLNSVVREQWGLHGYIVADCDAIDTIVTGHHYNDTFPAAVAQSLMAGLDLDCGITSPRNALEAVQKGLVQEAKIDEALRNLYVVLMRLGWFDGSYGNYSSLGRSDVCKPEAIELAAEAARQGIVLLKNDKHTLPFNFNSKNPTLAVIGPHANATYAMIGNYAIKNPCRYSTPLGALGMYGIVKYAPGCLDVKCPNIDGFSAAVEATKGADATVLFVGLDLSIEVESLDRVDLKLPINQETLINSVVNASTGPVVLVILSAGCIDISAFKNNPKVEAIVWAGYPGAEGGQAIADILFGHYNPGGRLPITWYPAEYTLLLPMTSMQLRPTPELGYPGRTYKFYNGTTIYPFGYGLSYTKFQYTISAPKLVSYDLELGRLPRLCKPIESSKKLFPDCESILISKFSKCNQTVTIVVGVANTGELAGSHVVLTYSVAPSDIIEAPIKRLIGFERVYIKRRETVQVRFDLNGCKSFSIIYKDGNELLPAGEHSVVVGDEYEKISTKIPFQFTNISFKY